jgi:hypothetical protein
MELLQQVTMRQEFGASPYCTKVQYTEFPRLASKNFRSYDNKRDNVAAMKLEKFIFIGLLVFTCALTIPVAAQQSGNPQGDSAEELAKKMQNPVADLIRVPFQNN